MTEPSSIRLGPRIFYLQDESGFPIACVAAVQKEVSPGTGNVTGVYALSIYNDADRQDPEHRFPYVPGRSRHIALGRIGYKLAEDGKKKKFVAEGRVSKTKAHKFYAAPRLVKRAILEEIAHYTRRPQVKAACMRWLLAHPVPDEVQGEHSESQADGHHEAE